MNRRAAAKLTSDARSSLVENARWLGEQEHIDPALIEAVEKARGKAESLVANQLGAVAALLDAVCLAMGKPPRVEEEPRSVDTVDTVDGVDTGGGGEDAALETSGQADGADGSPAIAAAVKDGGDSKDTKDTKDGKDGPATGAADTKKKVKVKR